MEKTKSNKTISNLKNILLKRERDREKEFDFEAQQALLQFPWSLWSCSIQIKLLKQIQLNSTDPYSQTKSFSNTDVRKRNHILLKALTSKSYSTRDRIISGPFQNQCQKKD